MGKLTMKVKPKKLQIEHEGPAKMHKEEMKKGAGKKAVEKHGPPGKKRNG